MGLRLTGKAMDGVSESETDLYIELIMIPTAPALEKAGVYRLLDLWAWGFVVETCKHYERIAKRSLGAWRICK